MADKVISKVWDVGFSLSAEKQYKKLKRNGSKPSIADIVNYLTAEMELEGPYRSNWPNYGPLDDDKFHCHLKKGKPTFVACWKVDKDNKKIKVYYVGTHENAPY
jgi:mRNA-degrading endonuclease YafQ of YafQ-DinJ toxin-antitoxin module